jgi:hypothetical protein
METDLEGAALMAKLREQMPGATIDAVLDAARMIHIRRSALSFKGKEFATVSRLVGHLTTLRMTDEDLHILVGILVENSEELIRTELASDLGAILQTGALQLLLTSASRLDTPTRPYRRPWCCCLTFPDTGKPGTDP